jgi:hypothetical protein
MHLERRHARDVPVPAAHDKADGSTPRIPASPQRSAGHPAQNVLSGPQHVDFIKPAPQLPFELVTQEVRNRLGRAAFDGAFS